MKRTVLCDNGRRLLWDLWAQFRAVVNQKVPFTFRGVEHGEAMCNAAKLVSGALEGSGFFEPVVYDDRSVRFVRACPHADVEREDNDGYRKDPKYSAPRNLVICEGGVAYLRDLAKRLYREDRVTTDEAERFAAHLYAVIEGQRVRVYVSGSSGDVEDIVYESFSFRRGEYKMVPLAAGEPHIYGEDDVSWKPFFAAIARGEKCEVDEAFYDYFLASCPRDS